MEFVILCLKGVSNVELAGSLLALVDRLETRAGWDSADLSPFQPAWSPSLTNTWNGLYLFDGQYLKVALMVKLAIVLATVIGITLAGIRKPILAFCHASLNRS